MLTIACSSLLAMVLQVAVLAAQLYLDEKDLMLTYVTHEVGKLAQAVRVTPDSIKVRLNRIPPHFRDAEQEGYAFKISTSDGRTLASRNSDMIEAVSPWVRSSTGEVPTIRQNMWVATLEPRHRLNIAGGERFSVHGTTFLVEVATRGDLRNSMLRILIAEIADDVWMPMVPLVLLTLFGTVFSVHHSLRPLAHMAQLAESASLSQLSLDANRRALPREVLTFVVAITSLLARVQELLAAQRIFVARAAHELRTPIAALMLEVDRPATGNAVRLKSDIGRLSQMVDRLLTLSRLETREIAEPQLIDLEFVAEEIVEQLAPLALKTRHSVSLVVKKPTTVTADLNAVQQTLRNLIQNAIVHTPNATPVAVTVGPEFRLEVSDNGPGWGAFDPKVDIAPFAVGSRSSGTGLGLSIVVKAADLLGAVVHWNHSDSGGVRVVIARST
jgi:signal transduction histidine kinase